MLTVIGLIFLCCKVCCGNDCDEIDAESPNETVPTVPPRDYDNRGTTSNTQPYYNNNNIGFAIGQTQPNLPYPPAVPASTFTPHVPSMPQPSSNLTEQFDCPPSYDDAMKQLSQK
ncbi:uncharacterized protein [Chironomus tepperi]|uniref:uncharacterized protein n=1 Tax=Chironomus tepperi TaxID=113505 RepID=UPI00391F25F8